VDSPEYREAIRHSDEAISEVQNADIIVIGTPMYNFSVPSALKAWIDHLVRIGKTFRYNEQGIPEPMVHGKKVYLAISTGGVYSDGPMKGYDFVDPYLRAVLGFIGLTDVTTYRAEGTAIPGAKEAAVQKAIDAVEV
jgi:FMN-dependent NADH-azoreductase